MVVPVVTVTVAVAVAVAVTMCIWGGLLVRGRDYIGRHYASVR